VFYDLGFLSQVEVVECSATDLIGQYVGQTGPKTIKQLERGLGKVLFIDEAYRLGEGHFAQEAVNELVDTITKPKFAGKLVIILAGYDNDMNDLLRVNEGLSSRFADEIIFPALSPDHCLQLLEEKLKQSEVSISALHNAMTRQALLRPIEELSKLPSWGNARDVQTLGKSMVRMAFQNIKSPTDSLVVPDAKAAACIQTMLSERLHRANIVPKLIQFPQQPVQTQTPRPPESDLSNLITTSTVTRTESRTREHQHELPIESKVEQLLEDIRDDGVSDAIWAQLQIDKEAAELEAKRQQQQLRDAEDAHRAVEEAEKKLAAETAAAELRAAQAKDEAKAMELLRQREEARIREMEAKAAREKIQKELEKRRLEEQKRKEKEAQVQVKLRQMGVCPVGYRWIKQSNGYRCSAGGHFVSDSQLGM
jgi:hypothetical protein